MAIENVGGHVMQACVLLSCSLYVFSPRQVDLALLAAMTMHGHPARSKCSFKEAGADVSFAKDPFCRIHDLVVRISHFDTYCCASRAG